MAVVNNKSGMPKFEPVEVSFQCKITAVCADDDENEDYFYVGDEEGNVFVLNNEGGIIASRKMPEETAGAVLMIMNITGVPHSFYAYSAKGWTMFKEVTSNISIEESCTNGANFSVDGDGTLHSGKEEGDMPALQYNATTEARVVRTVAITEGDEFGNFNKVFNFVIPYNESNIDTAVTTLSVRKGAGLGEEVRLLEFDAPVKQVISCRHHTGGEADDIYVLLCDGDLLKVHTNYSFFRCTYTLIQFVQYNGTQLFDRAIGNDDLEEEQVLDYYPDDIDDSETEKYLGGFAVYENKVAIYGSDGLYVADVCSSLLQWNKRIKKIDDIECYSH